jgi:hypothetical protein
MGCGTWCQSTKPTTSSAITSTCLSKVCLSVRLDAQRLRWLTVPATLSDPGQVALMLRDYAYSMGSADNISVIVVTNLQMQSPRL